MFTEAETGNHNTNHHLVGRSYWVPQAREESAHDWSSLFGAGCPSAMRTIRADVRCLSFLLPLALLCMQDRRLRADAKCLGSLTCKLKIWPQSGAPNARAIGAPQEPRDRDAARAARLPCDLAVLEVVADGVGDGAAELFLAFVAEASGDGQVPGVHDDRGVVRLAAPPPGAS